MAAMLTYVLIAQSTALTAYTACAVLIRRATALRRVVREIMLFLHAHGVETVRAVRIFKTYGADAVQLISENPWFCRDKTVLPAAEAQVDYGEGAPTLDIRSGRYRRPRLFVMTLGASRHAFRKTVWKSSKETWCQLHEEAFVFFWWRAANNTSG